jgi:hypothetical protein
MDGERREYMRRGAEIIRQHLGGNRFAAMTDAQFAYDSNAQKINLSVRFRGSRSANALEIILDDDDTYTMRFGIYRPKLAEYTVVYETRGVYADMLQDVFERVTGLKTQL